MVSDGLVAGFTTFERGYTAIFHRLIGRFTR